MRRKLAPRAFAVTLMMLALVQTGCSTMNNTEKGVGLGGLLGAGVGTAIGAVTGNPRTGAVVGGLAGAGIGGIIGNDTDRTEKKQTDANVAAASYAYDQAQPARIDEIVQMAKNGQSDRVIVNHIRQSHMRFTLSAADLNYLKTNGVPDTVIVEMQTPNYPVGAGRTRQPVVVVREPVYVREAPPVVFVQPFGYGYGHCRQW